MVLHCPNCRLPIHTDTVCLEDKTAACAICRLVFPFEDQLEPATKHPETHDRMEIPRPDGVEEQSGDDLFLKWRWLSMGYVREVLTRALMGFVLGGTGIKLVSLLPSRHAEVLLLLVVPSAILLVLFWVYHVAARFLNHTYLHLSGNRLHVWTSPLPRSRGVSILTKRLDQLFCRVRKRGKRVAFDLCAKLVNGKTIHIARDLSNPWTAWYFEQEIEARLGIVDRPMRGEFR